MDYRQQAQAAYVLHQRPYRDSSSIVDFFTLEHGRVSAVAKGTRRPGSRLRGALQPFVPLQISWQGRHELKTLIQAEAVAINGLFQGTALICGLYLNELLQRLLRAHDSYPTLYLYYQYVLNELIRATDIQGALRTFERRLLAELGYGLPLNDINPQQHYLFDAQHWCFQPVNTNHPGAYQGALLLSIVDDCYDTPQRRQTAKRLMRQAIDHLLDGKPLQSRALFS